MFIPAGFGGNIAMTVSRSHSKNRNRIIFFTISYSSKVIVFTQVSKRLMKKKEK